MWKANGKTATLYFSWIVSFQSGDIYVISAWEDGRQEDEEEDVEAARWPWGWERMLSFDGGGSGSRYWRNRFGGGFGSVVRQNTMNE
jgi:hypothetical protein